MGNYNSQYESYYSKVVNNKRNYDNYSNYSYRNNSDRQKKRNGNYLTRRLFRELIGVFCLFFMVLVCKIVVTPQTTAVYNYSKNIIEQNYDYTYLIEKAKSLQITNIGDLQQKLQDMIEAAKIKITGGETLKNKVKDNFIPPTSGEITSNYGDRIDPVTGKESFHEGVDINAKEGTEVKAAFDGNVKEFSESETLGKFILIDHGSGLESRYAHLSEFSVQKDSRVKKGDIIAKSGNTGKSTAPHLHFELLYMGSNVDPLEYINFDVK